MERGVRENGANERDEARLVAEAGLPVVKAVAEEGADFRLVPIGVDEFVRRASDGAGHAVAAWKADPQGLRFGVLVISPALDARPAARADADHVDRAMTRVVIGVAEEVLGGELPVRGEHPLVHADALGAALAPVAMIETKVELLLGVAEVGQKLWCILVPRRPNSAFVDGELGHWHQ